MSEQGRGRWGAGLDIALREWPVEKDLTSLPKPLIARVLDRLKALKSDPLPRQSTELRGSERLYRIRVGDYRIVYELGTAALQIMIHYVRHRREVYPRLR